MAANRAYLQSVILFWAEDRKHSADSTQSGKATVKRPPSTRGVSLMNVGTHSVRGEGTRNNQENMRRIEGE